MHLIYVLKNPDGDVRYIGQTTNAKKRLGSHISSARHGTRTRAARWIRSLDQHGAAPTMEVIHRVAGDVRWQTMERLLIAAAVAWDMQLMNGTAGGDGVDLCAEDRDRVKKLRHAGLLKPGVQARKSRSLGEIWARDDVRDKWIASLKAAATGADARARLLAAAKAPRSEEGKKAQADGRTAYWANPANRERQAERMRAIGRANAKT